MKGADILVVGAGIAGVSAAAELAEHASVLLIEQEGQPGSHATGRSAALIAYNYGSCLVRALTRLSGSFLSEPPDGFASHPLITDRGILQIARAEQRDAFEAAASDPHLPDHLLRLSGDDARALVPILKPETVEMALLDPIAADIDVHELISAYVRRFKSRGGRLEAGCPLLSLVHDGGRWLARTAAGVCEAKLIVNAAGAWAEPVGLMAGSRGLGLKPLRRSAILVDGPADHAFSNWPMTVDLDESFYFKPDAGQLMISPCDSTPWVPCDVRPDEWDVAIAADRFERATGLSVARVHAAWAGLRTFAPDDNPVIGYDPEAPDFFWLAGQGGFGIQTAPALARAVAGLILSGALPGDLLDAGVARADMDPSRFSRPANPATTLALREA